MNNPIGFIWKQEKCSTDPNCITLTTTVSHRLGNMLGTYDNEQFSPLLEGHINLLTSKNIALKKSKQALEQELSEAKQQIEILAMQRLYLCMFFAVAVIFDVLLVCK